MDFFDLHCDTVTECMNQGESLRENSLHLSLNRASVFEKWCQVFAIFVPDSLNEDEAAEYFDKGCDFLLKEISENEDKIALCKTSEDLRTVSQNGRCAALLAMENSKAVTSVSGLSKLYELGLRVITLTWNGANAAGGGVRSGGGLTAWGIELVRAAESFGIVVDASHLSDAAFWDLTRVSTAPFIASHSNAREVLYNRRSLTDEQIKHIVKIGGLIGLNFYSEFLGGKGGMAELLRHARHMLNLGAEDVLCIGSDFDGAQIDAELAGIEKIPYVRQYFVQNGIPSSLCDKIFFENAFNFFENVLQP